VSIIKLQRLIQSLSMPTRRHAMGFFSVLKDLVNDTKEAGLSEAVELFFNRVFQTFDYPQNPLKLSAAEFGIWAENQASRFLKKTGLKILARNYRTPVGELDIIAQDSDMLVFVEVKAVRDAGGQPEFKVNREKRRKTMAAAKCFIGRKNFHDRPARFDIVTVKIDKDRKPLIEHESNAFQAEGR